MGGSSQQQILTKSPPIMSEGEYTAYQAQMFPKCVPSYVEYMAEQVIRVMWEDPGKKTE